MVQPLNSNLPPPSPEHRRIAAGKFERANQVVATGHFDYGIHLLRACCKLDPANLRYRQALRRIEKAKYRNNQRGSRLAWLTSWWVRARLRAALQTGDYLQALEQGERLLMGNPWDVHAQAALAEAAAGLGLLEVAIWSLEQARQTQARSAALNRALARLYEKAGNFTQALALWDLMRKADPADTEALQKVKDLAAQDTIARGNFGDGLAEAVRPREEAQAGGKGDPASPEAALRARLQAEPTSSALYLELARLYRRAEQLEQAHAVLREGLGASGNAFELGAELADLEIEPFRRNLAITEEKLRATPDDPELRKLRLRLRKEVNTRELELFRQKADRFPAELDQRYELGVRLLRAGQLDEAIRELQVVRADARLRWQALLYLGYCFKARNNWRLAQRNLEEALEHLPAGEVVQRKEALFELATGCAEAGDLARALDYAHELANLDFTYRGVKDLLDDWQARLQQARLP
jgi:tetratricopeptide (TPR) repeat protein